MAHRDLHRPGDAREGRDHTVQVTHVAQAALAAPLARVLVGIALVLGLAAPRARAQSDFDETREIVAELLHAGHLEEAVERLEELDFNGGLNALRRIWIRNRIAELYLLMGRYTAALAELEASERLIAGGSDFPNWRELMRVSKERLHARVLLDWGLIDKAVDELLAARQRLDGLKGKGPPLDEETVMLNYEEVTIRAAQQDWDGMLDCAKRSLYGRDRELYALRPRERAQILAKVGVGLYEVTRLDQAAEVECRTQLELALDIPDLPPSDRLAPRLAQVQLAHRARTWKQAEARLAAATTNLGPPETRRSVPYYYATWVALAARLAVERTDRVATREELVAHHEELGLTIEEEFARWEATEIRPGGYGFLSYNPSQLLLSEWIRLTLLLGEEREPAVEAALEVLFQAHSHGTLVRRLGGAAPDLEAFRSLWIGADPEHLVLVYLPAADRSHLFVLDSKSVEHHELAAVDPLEEARRALEREVRAPMKEDAPKWRRARRAEALADMSRKLLPDELVPQLASAERLTIVGLDLLGEVPFESLSAGELGPLGRRFAITYLPSLALGEILAERVGAAPLPKNEESSVLLVGSPDPARPLISEKAFRAMVGAYESRAQILRTDEATFAGLCADAPDAQVLQLYTHGRLDRQRERPATLELAVESGTSYYGADEMEEGLDAPEIVLLTVCGTARGPLRRGDASAAELASAYFLAGTRTRCVIASAFDLEANAAARIARTFHREILAGETPAEAMRIVREELAGDERFADPFYHSLIRVIGQGHRPVFQR